MLNFNGSLDGHDDGDFYVETDLQTRIGSL